MLLISCGSAPKMERKVEVWNGAPEVGGICRMTPDQAARKTNGNPFIAKMAIRNRRQECIDAREDRFKEYGAMTFSDIGVIQRYIETLINSCKGWKR